MLIIFTQQRNSESFKRNTTILLIGDGVTAEDVETW